MRQVHPHQKVGYTQVQDEHPEALAALHSVGHNAVEERGRVSQQGQGGKNGQYRSVGTGAKQRIAGGNFVRRGMAPGNVETVRQNARTAHLVVVSVNHLQLMKAVKYPSGEDGQRRASQVQHPQTLHGLKPAALQTIQSTLGQVQLSDPVKQPQPSEVRFHQRNARQIKPLKPRQACVQEHVTSEVGCQRVAGQEQIPHAAQQLHVRLREWRNTVVTDVKAKQVGKQSGTQRFQSAPGNVLEIGLNDKQIRKF